MKAAITTLTIIVIALGIAIAVQFNHKGVTASEFYETHEVLQLQIDSIKLQLVDITANQEEMQNNQDTLKVGQKVIYQQVNRDNIPFFDKILELWK